MREIKAFLANDPDATRLFPASRPMARPNQVGPPTHLTSANSATPYRDDLFGPRFAHSVFISEPAYNIVHQEVLEPSGSTFRSHRAAGETNQEFLASADNWFRPTMLKTGPDGALYIADMYRLHIEHPEYIPEDVKKFHDLRAGEDRGRIYRLFPKGAGLRPNPHLEKLSPTQWAQALESPNGWQRDLLQRLLIATNHPATVPILRDLALRSPRPVVQAQAMWTLQGMGKLAAEVLRAGLLQADPNVRVQALRLLENRLRAGTQDSEMAAALTRLARDENMEVRFQLALTLAEWRQPEGAALIVALADAPVDDWLKTALLISSLAHLPRLPEALSRHDQASQMLLGPLVEMSVRSKNGPALEKLVQLIGDPGQKLPSSERMKHLATLVESFDELEGSKGSDPLEASRKVVASRLQPALEEARKIASPDSGGGSPADEIRSAMRLLGRGDRDHDKDFQVLAGWLSPRYPTELSQEALTQLSRRTQPEAAQAMLRAWKGAGPSLQSGVVLTLLTRPSWTALLLKSLDQGQVPRQIISASQQQQLLKSPNLEIRKQAALLFQKPVTDRQQVVKQWESVMSLKGSSSLGKIIFQKNCASCHKWGDEGAELGPDLRMVVDKTPSALLIAILDPNRVVEARYAGFNLVTRDDRELSGVVVAETPSSITLRAPNRPDETILRTQIKELNSTGLSPMPEGLEQAMTKQEMADLIAFLTNF